MRFPTPDTRFPVTMPDGSVFKQTVFLSAVLDHPNLRIGAYTYYSDMQMPEDFEAIQHRLFPYLYGAQEIEIGKFCSLAEGTRFVTDSANHRYDGFSAYPFAIFDGMSPERPSMPPNPPRPTRVGHDCWFGRDAMVLPGAEIGHGVIIGAGAVVGRQVPAYAVVAGNPARIVRMRFSEDVIARLLTVRWWDWPIDQILAHEAEICGGDIDALEAIATNR